MTDASGYAGYVDTHYLQEAAQAHEQDKQDTYRAMCIEAGHHVLDVGCGPGLDTVALATLVGATGDVTGADSDGAMVAEADRRAAEAAVSGWVCHVEADAASLPFDAARFDSCRSERLFQHVADAGAVLAEMVRVTRPGGRIVVLDTDYATLSIDSAEVELERRLARFTAARVRNGYSARGLYRLLTRQGLAEISISVRPQLITSYAHARRGWLEQAEQEACAAGQITEDELVRWRESLQRASADNVFFATLNHILAVGRKP
ncbi:MAG: hypothetical protein PVSMB4_07150 [Ktedonobacterales bacterium]